MEIKEEKNREQQEQTVKENFACVWEGVWRKDGDPVHEDRIKCPHESAEERQEILERGKLEDEIAIEHDEDDSGDRNQETDEKTSVETVILEQDTGQDGCEERRNRDKDADIRSQGIGQGNVLREKEEGYPT